VNPACRHLARIGLGWSLGLAASVSACGSKADPEPTHAVADPHAASWADRLADPSPEVVLEALGQPHARAREVLGPHRLAYRARFSLVPDEQPTVPPVGEPAATAQSVDDELVLVWGSSPGEEPRFSLAQENNHDRGREVILVDEKLYTRLRYRGWFVRPLYSDIHELWLDSAQLCVRDLVELALPRLVVTPVEREPDELVLELGLRHDVDASLVPRTGWRREAQIEEVAGTVVVERTSGLWRSTDVHVRYRVRDAAGGVLRGEASIEGTVECLGPAAARISPPADATPTPERLRYEAERKRLLDGLAAP
jgi:hypothetical protein